MPKALLDYLGYVIYFWIGDGTEPVHVHISPGKQIKWSYQSLDKEKWGRACS